MNVNLPKVLDNSSLISPEDMESNKVYRFAHLLVCQSSTDCIITVDVNDKDVLTFDNYYDFETHLDDNDFPKAGELTPLQMTLSFK